MTVYMWLFIAWGLVTIAFFALLMYRSRLTKQETAWISLTDDAREDRAIQAQTMIEMKARKLTLPIRALGTASVVILLAILGFWIYEGIMNPPPTP
jgi:hypothetical protein